MNPGSEGTGGSQEDKEDTPLGDITCTICTKHPDIIVGTWQFSSMLNFPFILSASISFLRAKHCSRWGVCEVIKQIFKIPLLCNYIDFYPSSKTSGFPFSSTSPSHFLLSSPPLFVANRTCLWAGPSARHRDCDSNEGDRKMDK